jgi:hypothetical protein
MTISEWDGVEEESKGHRCTPRLPSASLAARVVKALLFRFSDGFICALRPPPSLPRRASDPLGGGAAAQDKAQRSAIEPQKNPRSWNSQAPPSSASGASVPHDPRARTPLKTPSKDARAVAVTPHAAARERERVRARDRAQVTSVLKPRYFEYPNPC